MARDQLVEKFGLLGDKTRPVKDGWTQLIQELGSLGGENRKKDGGPGKLDYTKLVRCTR